MNKNIFAFIVLATISLSCSAQTLTFKNKSDMIIRIAPGSRAVPPYDIPLAKTSAVRVKPGQDGELKVVDNEEFPQIMFWQEGKPKVAYIYEFNAKPGKKLQVQLTSDMKFTSVPFTFNTITKDDIISKGVVDLEAKDAGYAKSIDDMIKGKSTKK